MNEVRRRPISIWRPTTVDGEPAFRRPEPGPFSDHYATRRVIFARSRRPHRICLLGESTAAGYLLSPHLTPADVLQQRLGGAWEVVDLARTNERLESLVRTAESSTQLAPDCLVVFTGNNWNLLETPEWSPYVPSTVARQGVAEMLRREGWPGPARAAAAALRQRVEESFARLAALGIPITVVVPEVNLADWESPQPVGWLPGDGVTRWYRLLDAAHDALARGDLHTARSHTTELLELDRGSAPTGLRLLSRILLAQGEAERARTAARAEVDTVRYAAMAVLAAPQATATAQELLRAGAARHGFSLIDLPEVFGRFERLPGRRLFYDYCHLTPEGIDLAMTAVAQGFVDEPVPGGLELTPRARAAAELGAAIHGAHRGLEGEVPRYWLARAVETDPGAVDLLLDLVAARTAPVPSVLTPRQLVDPWLNPQHGWKWQHLDAEVITAIEEQVGRATIAPLLGPPRIEPWNPVARFYPEAMEHEDLPPPLFLRAPWPRIDFAVVADGVMEVELVVRAPPATHPSGGGVELSMGLKPVARIEIGSSWRRHRVRIPARPGLNRLTLRLPFPETRGEEMLQRSIDRLEAGQPADLHPVFGEVLSLRPAG